MKLFKYVGHIAALLALLAAGSAMAQQALVAGRDYTQISPAQPTDSGKKIEIIEFFWYTQQIVDSRSLCLYQKWIDLE